MTKLFILVDDDPLNNLLLKKTIEKNCAGSDVKDFVEPELALSYIEYEFGEKSSENKITLFLDINMPTLTGWDFLEEFEKFPVVVKNQFKIYILSSSIDPADIKRAKQNPLVLDFIEKPINKDFLIKTFF